MQENPPAHQMPHRTPLAERQARVGIIANATVVSLPAQPPREIWTRWPKLRSSRRAGQHCANHSGGEQPDAVASGDMLDELRRDLRRQASDAPVLAYPTEDVLPETPPLVRMRWVRRLALAVFAGVLGVIGLAFMGE